MENFKTRKPGRSVTILSLQHCNIGVLPLISFRLCPVNVLTKLPEPLPRLQTHTNIPCLVNTPTVKPRKTQPVQIYMYIIDTQLHEQLKIIRHSLTEEVAFESIKKNKRIKTKM